MKTKKNPMPSLADVFNDKSFQRSNLGTMLLYYGSAIANVVIGLLLCTSLFANWVVLNYPFGSRTLSILDVIDVFARDMEYLTIFEINSGIYAYLLAGTAILALVTQVMFIAGCFRHFRRYWLCGYISAFLILAVAMFNFFGIRNVNRYWVGTGPDFIYVTSLDSAPVVYIAFALALCQVLMIFFTIATYHSTIAYSIVRPVKELVRYKDLLVQLVSRDLKLKYRRSFLGYLWSVLSPLMIMGVQVIVFSQMFKRNIPNYPVYLLSGQVLFNYMNQSTHMAINSIIDSRELIKKVYLPKYIFTISKITSGLIDLIFSMGALMVVMLFSGVGYTWHFLLFPFVLLQLYVFCLGLGLFLAQANVFFRDIQYIYTVVTTAWLYLTPIFYDIEALPLFLQKVVKIFNPMLYYVAQFRSVVLYHVMPDWQKVVAGTAAAVLMLAFGIFCFTRKQDDFILYI